MPNIEAFTRQYFRNVKGSASRGYMTKCPCHADKKESLGISYANKPDKDGGRQIVVNCLAGCSTDDILNAIGATWSDLTGGQPAQSVTDKILNYYRKKPEFGPGAFIKDKYKYTDEKGKYLYDKFRFEGTASGKKEIRYAIIDEIAGTWKAGKGGRTASLYRLPELIKSIAAGYPVHITEGEKDANTVHEKLNAACVCAGGVSDWKEAYNAYFRGATVTIWADNDEPGQKYANRIKKQLLRYAYRVRIITPSNALKGDITDFFDAGGTVDDLKQIMKKTPYDYATWVNVTEDKKGNVIDRVNADLLSMHVQKHENYLIVRQPNDDKDALYSYRHGVYDRVNKNDFIALHIRPYIPAGKGTPTTLENVYKLILASMEKRTTWEELDADDRYINFKNCLLEVGTGETWEHTPEILSTLQLQFDYDKEAHDMPKFTHLITDISRDDNGDPDEEVINRLQEWYGFALSNFPVKLIKKALFLLSLQGNTGKSTLLRILGAMLGYRTKAIDLKSLDNGSGNRFNLGGAWGARVLETGDQAGGEIKESAIFKRLTGGDLQKMEEKGKQGVSQRYRGIIVILCNELPYFSDDLGKHVIERMSIIKLFHSIPEEQRDGTLEDEIIARELPAVFNWAYEGLKRLMNNGFKFSPCENSKRALIEYRTRGDSVYRYLLEHYTETRDDEDKVPKTDFENGYAEWVKAINDAGEEYIKPVMKKNIAKRLISYGYKEPKATTYQGAKGVRCYRGLIAGCSDPYILAARGEMPFDDQDEQAAAN